MRVVFFGTYDVEAHPRVEVLIEGLRALGHTVVDVNAPLGIDTASRVDALRHPAGGARLAVRLARAWARLLWQSRRVRRPDAVVVGYLGQFDVHMARLRWPGAPRALDFLTSLEETARDRGLAGGPLLRRVLAAADRAALGAADTVVVDTSEHADALPPGARARAVQVPVGAPRAWFRDLPPRPGHRADPLSVVFFGLFTPLQGAPVIGAAIAELAASRPDVRFTMIGSGQDWAAARAAVGALPQVQWRPWVGAEALAEVVAAHDVCLGIFGTGDKARRVVPNKVFQGAAAGCAVVTSDTAPQREALGDAGVYVPPGDPAALAAALAALADDRAALEAARKRASQRAFQRFTPAAVAVPLERALESLAGGATRRDRPAALPPLTPHGWLRWDVVRRLLAGEPHRASLLEIGAGQGAAACRLAQQFRYTGIEPDAASREVALQRLARVDGGADVHGDLHALPADATFDVVCAFEVLEHIEDDEGALREWVARVADGGLLLLSVPLHQHRFGPADVHVGHYRRYGREQLAERLRNAGLEDPVLVTYGFGLGHALERVRNGILRRRAASGAIDERTAASGRLLQPDQRLGALTKAATVPFHALQRPFAGTALGTGLVAAARRSAA